MLSALWLTCVHSNQILEVGGWPVLPPPVSSAASVLVTFDVQDLQHN